MHHVLEYLIKFAFQHTLLLFFITRLVQQSQVALLNCAFLLEIKRCVVDVDSRQAVSSTYGFMCTSSGMAGVRSCGEFFYTSAIWECLLSCKHSVYPDKVPLFHFRNACDSPCHCSAVAPSSYRILGRTYASLLNYNCINSVVVYLNHQ